MESNNSILNAVRAIVKNKPLDIDISEILHNHKCFYLLSILKKAAADMVYNKSIISIRYNTCASVFKAMKSLLPYAVIKGAVLSQSAYGDIMYRKSGDIDLLVSRDNIDILIKIMRDNGFIQGRISNDDIIPFTRQEILFHSSLTHQAAPFVKKTDNMLCPYIEIDINMDVLWGESKVKIDTGYFLSNTAVSKICGITVQKLNPVMEFITLCLHHYKDMNSIYLLSQGSLKLYLFCDIYFYLINNSVDITELSGECDKLNVSEYIYYCVYYANLVFCDIQLNGYLAALKNEKSENILDTFGLDDTERKFWKMDFCERLFWDRFNEEFNRLLTEKDKEKINRNLFFM